MARKKITDSLKVGTYLYVHFSLISLSQALVSQRGIQREEKKELAEQVNLFFLLVLSASGIKLLLSALILLLKLY